jgi:putative Holliday junction resolvase
MTDAARYLGIDMGTRRVGLAVGDSAARLARPLGTVAPEQLAARLTTEGPFAALVVGLPRGLDGQDTPQTLAVRRFVDASLGEYEIIYQDEAATSEIAKAELEASGKPYKREDIDAQAAAIILQDFLDSL